MRPSLSADFSDSFWLLQTDPPLSFPLDKPVPTKLIDAIAKFRAIEALGRVKTGKRHVKALEFEVPVVLRNIDKRNTLAAWTSRPFGFLKHWPAR